MSELKKILFHKKTILSFLFISIGGLLNLYNGFFAYSFYKDAPVSKDILFDMLPYYSFMGFFSDFFVGISIACFFYYLFPKKMHMLPYFLSVFGAMYLVRSFMILLTPLGIPPYSQGFFGSNIKTGYFTSGHTALSFLIYLLIDRKEYPKTKIFTGILLVLEMMALLLARYHYSIDIAGGLMVAYIIFIELEKKKDELTISLDK